VIILTRLGGHQMAVNPDLFSRAEATPDTVITLVDGHKLVVTEPIQEVIARIRHWRASIVAEAQLLTSRVIDEPGPGEETEPGAVAAGPPPTEETARVTALTRMDSPLARILLMPTRED
jgi:flagellar protein FlbD